MDDDSNGPEVAQFSVVDYLVFAGMLSVSMAIGIYHSVKGNKTTEEFLLAGREMSVIPVAFSLTATYLSSISILGYVGEVYGQGLQLVWSLLGNALGIAVSAMFLMPVMYPLRLSSVNEYIERRFHSVFLRKFVLLVSSINNVIYLGFCLYAPTLALESVTPLDLDTYIWVLGIIVTLYSAFGGLKAVVWTDTFQTVVIIFGILVATGYAMAEVGGMGAVWTIAKEDGRTDALDFRLGLYQRHTVFNTILNGFMTFFAIYSFSQATIQRVATMPDLAKVRLVLFMNTFGLTVLLAILFITGLCVFAVYQGCDPLTLGLVSQKDQLLPYYVMEYLGVFKGIPGLFVACLFSGTLSSISSLLSAVASMLWIDFFCELNYFKTASEGVRTATTKTITIILGLMMIGLAFLASTLGGLVQATASVFGALSGPTLGVFVLGVMFPHCGKRGAIAGVISGTVIMVWLAIGSQSHGMKTELLPLSIEDCPRSNSSWGHSTWGPDTTTEGLPTTSDTPEDPGPLSFFYGISYTFFSTLGLTICLGVANLVTLVTGSEDLSDVDPALVLRCLRKYVGKKDADDSSQAKQNTSGVSESNLVALQQLNTNSSSTSSARSQTKQSASTGSVSSSIPI